jgi:glycosyltransferase involved in cell wall biosynthesis
MFARAGACSAFLVVCTEQGRRDMGLSPAEVLENAYPTPPHTPSLERPVRHDVVLFVGSFNYGPNLDGARWLLDEVLPVLEERVPDVQVRLVGRSADAVPVRSGRVTAAAHVPDLSADLAAAALSVVPLRHGSGSRIKILESFAHGIPVVSTTVGAEGLAVQRGEHLLVADDAVGFADACASVLQDSALAHRLTASAHARYMERYSTAAFEARVTRLVEQATA